MAKLVWALICQRVLLDQPTNRMSYIDALDAVSLAQFPVKAPQVLLTSVWQRGAESRLEMKVRVYSPAGSMLTEAVASPLDFSPEHRRARMSVAIGGFDIETPGRYEFAIETPNSGNWTEVQRVPFDVDDARVDVLANNAKKLLG